MFLSLADDNELSPSRNFLVDKSFASILFVFLGAKVFVHHHVYFFCRCKQFLTGTCSESHRTKKEHAATVVTPDCES